VRAHETWGTACAKPGRLHHTVHEGCGGHGRCLESVPYGPWSAETQKGGYAWACAASRAFGGAHGAAGGGSQAQRGAIQRPPSKHRRLSRLQPRQCVQLWTLCSPLLCIRTKQLPMRRIEAMRAAAHALPPKHVDGQRSRSSAHHRNHAYACTRPDPHYGLLQYMAKPWHPISGQQAPFPHNQTAAVHGQGSLDASAQPCLHIADACTQVCLTRMCVVGLATVHHPVLYLCMAEPRRAQGAPSSGPAAVITIAPQPSPNKMHVPVCTCARPCECAWASAHASGL